MKLSELRPCDFCGGPLIPQFYILQYKQAIFTPQTQQMLSATQIMGGSLVIAEALFPRADEAVLIIEDAPGIDSLEIIVCRKCFMEREIRFVDLMGVTEKLNQERKTNDP